MTSTAACDFPPGAYESLLSQSGLKGAYKAAECALGREIYEAALSGRGAYLWGLPGRGKTWAAACAVRLWVESHGPSPDRSGRAWLVSEHALAGFSSRDIDDRCAGASLERAQTVGLLVLDDLGAGYDTAWRRANLEGLIDARLMGGLPTVVTSNLKPGEVRDEWGGIEGARLASRVCGMCGRAVEVGGEDRRLAAARG